MTNPARPHAHARISRSVIVVGAALWLVVFAIVATTIFS